VSSAGAEPGDGPPGRQRSGEGRSRRASRPLSSGSAFDAGLRIIVRRDHSVVELRRKLFLRGYDQAEIDSAQARLMEHGFLGDQTFAEHYVRRRSRSLGPLAISAELAARGVDRETAERALERLDPHKQLLAAHRLADRLAGNTRYASYRELLHSVGAKLLRRGFPMNVARAVCEGVWRGTGDTPDP